MNSTLADARAKGDVQEILSTLKALGSCLDDDDSDATAAARATQLRAEMLRMLDELLANALPAESEDSTILRVQPLAVLSRGSLDATALAILNATVVAAKGSSMSSTLAKVLVSAVANLRKAIAVGSSSTDDVAAVNARYTEGTHVVMKAVLSTMAAGEPAADVSSDEAALTMKVQRVPLTGLASDACAVTDCKWDGSTAVRFPSEVASLFTQSVSSITDSANLAKGAVDMLTSSSPKPWGSVLGSSHASDTHGIVISSAARGADEVEEVSGLQSTIELDLPVGTADTHTYECNFWDTAIGNHSAAGCSKCGESSTHITCCCEHLTDFLVIQHLVPVTVAPSSSPTSAPTASPTAGVGNNTANNTANSTTGNSTTTNATATATAAPSASPGTASSAPTSRPTLAPTVRVEPVATVVASASVTIGLEGVSVQEFDAPKVQQAFKSTVALQMAVNTADVTIDSYSMAAARRSSFLEIQFTVAFSDADAALVAVTAVRESVEGGTFAATLTEQTQARGVAITATVSFVSGAIDEAPATPAPTGPLGGTGNGSGLLIIIAAGAGTIGALLCGMLAYCLYPREKAVIAKDIDEDAIQVQMSPAVGIPMRPGVSEDNGVRRRSGSSEQAPKDHNVQQI